LQPDNRQQPEPNGRRPFNRFSYVVVFIGH
jgi:hypothetical protein